MIAEVLSSIENTVKIPDTGSTITDLISFTDRLVKSVSNIYGITLPLITGMYKENTVAVTFFIIGLVLLAVTFLLLLFIKFNHQFKLLWVLIKDTAKYISRRFKELFKEKN